MTQENTASGKFKQARKIRVERDKSVFLNENYQGKGRPAKQDYLKVSKQMGEQYNIYKVE